MLRVTSYIRGRALPASRSAPAFDAVNPASGQPFARVQAATAQDVHAAVQAAADAQAEWAATPVAARAQVLLRAASLLEARADELAALETLDTGKPISETRSVDAAAPVESLRFFAGAAPALRGATTASGALTVREPLGVCAAISAWNYPLMFAGWKAAPALAAGNAVVLKPSEVAGLSALQVAEALAEAGLPAGAFNVVLGAGDTGDALVRHPGVAKVSFTGSVGTGAAVAAAAAAGIKRTTLELGGKSALLVFDDFDVAAAVEGALLANFTANGQVCSNATRVFVHRAVHDEFVERLVARCEEALVVGDPMLEETNVGPLASAAQLAKVEGYVGRGRAEGASLVFGGRRLDALGPGFYFEPAVLTGVPDASAVAQEEIFGPVMAVMQPFDDEAEAVARANATPFGLAAGVFTNSLERARRVAGALRAGSVYLNTYNLAPPDAPFGGVKQSGVGRENGVEALEAYTEVKTVYVGSGGLSF